MNIGIDIRECEKGKATGIGRVLRNFLSYVGEHDTDNQYVLFGNQKTEYTDLSHNQRVRIMPEKVTLLWDHIILPQAIQEEKIDVFWSPYVKGPFFTKAKLVTTIHDLIPLIVSEYRTGKEFVGRIYFNIILTLSLKRATKIIAVSQCTKNDLIKRDALREEKIGVITESFDERMYNPLDSGRDDILSRYGINEKFVFYCGNLNPHKNVGSLITAYQKLSPDIRKEYQLVIGGRKSACYKDLLRMVTQGDSEGKVIFTDHLPDKELPVLYRKASLFVFPSLYEGFGLPVLEAMACGTPVITSRVSSLPEVAGDAAILVNPRDSNELAQVIETVLCDKGLCNDLIQKGLARAKIFSREKMSREILDILKGAYRS
ncbi:MAG: glycosyltransferase family 4 protein [Candidatus Omnitrophica bacterium]|nr:glycosyltransferase family 4 protein [Candidatus Omnitrophota bacterium]